MGYNSVSDNAGLSLFVHPLLAPNTKSRAKSREMLPKLTLQQFKVI